MADKFEEDLRALVLAPAVADLVDDRAVWGELPAGKPRPCISLWNTTRDHDYNMDGASGLKQAFVQLDCWAMTYAQAKSVARAVTAAIDAHKGTTTDTDFQGVFVRGTRDSDEPVAGAPAQRYFRCSLDLEVWYAATIDADS